LNNSNDYLIQFLNLITNLAFSFLKYYPFKPLPLAFFTFDLAYLNVILIFFIYISILIIIILSSTFKYYYLQMYIIPS